MSTVVPTWQLEFNDRISAFSTAIGVPVNTVRELFTKLGADGNSEQSLIIIESEEYLPMADLFAEFVDSNLTQKSRLRLGVAHLRGKTSLSESLAQPSELSQVVGAIKDMVSSNRPKKDWTDEELLKSYDDTSTEIWQILRERSHGRPFIVFKSDKSINVEESLKLLRIAKKQPTPGNYRIGGTLVRLFRAGEFISVMLDESPFAKGHVLVENYCAATDTDWAGVSEEARIICRIYTEKVETAKLSQREMKNIAHLAKDVKILREELGAAALLYDELKEQDNLPKLKISGKDIKSQNSKTDNSF